MLNPQHPLPSGDVCPYSFVESRVAVHMIPTSASPDAPNVDVFECKNCGTTIEVE